MRGERGRLICVWSPLLHGEGCSTIACTLGLGLNHGSAGRVLMLDRSGSVYGMNCFLDKDIEVRYSIDNLKILGTSIKADHVRTYGTQVNTELYMLSGSRLEYGQEMERNEFDSHFLDSCLEGFDLVIADIGTGLSEMKSIYLDRADHIVSVSAPNEYMMDHLFSKAVPGPVLEYFTGEKTIHAINKLHSSWEVNSVISRYLKRYGIKNLFGFEYDGDMLNACCSERKLYSFFNRRYGDKNYDYMRQLEDICSFVAGELSLAGKHTETTASGGIFRRLRRISLF